MAIPRSFRFGASLPRVPIALALISLCLGGCLTAAGPDDPLSFGHAAWCGSNPPSGYCIVPERD